VCSRSVPSVISRLTPLTLVLVGALLVMVPAAPGAAQDQSTTTTVLLEEGDLPGVIPRPGQGREPQHSGDRGGWAQLLLAGVLVAGVGVVFTVVVRSAARTTKAKEKADPDANRP
jgi:hypothetical protein